MQSTNTDIHLAHELDAQDELAGFRQEFVVQDPDLIYLDGNSLGRLPRRTPVLFYNQVELAWGERLFEWGGSPSGPIAAMVPISPSFAGSVRPSASPALRGCAFMMLSPVLACGRAA